MAEFTFIKTLKNLPPADTPIVGTVESIDYSKVTGAGITASPVPAEKLTFGDCMAGFKALGLYTKHCNVEQEMSSDVYEVTIQLSLVLSPFDMKQTNIGQQISEWMQKGY